MTWFIVWSSLLFVLGLFLGAWWGVGRGERNAMEEIRWRRAQAEARAGGTRSSLVGSRGGTVMPYRPPEVAHEAYALPAGDPVLYERRRPRDAREDPDLIGKILRQPPEHELTDEEFTARLAGWADEIIAAARLAPDPYDQLWSTQ